MSDTRKYMLQTYRLTWSEKPKDVLSKISDFITQNDLSYQKRYWNLTEYITEFEFDGKFHSNRTRNSVTRLCKKYPELLRFRQDEIQLHEFGVNENLILCNYSKDGRVIDSGKKIDDLIYDVCLKVPVNYSFIDTEYGFEGLDFFGIKPLHQSKVSCNPDDESDYQRLDMYGSYIYYSRQSCGSEKHQYLCLALDITDIEKSEAEKLCKQFFSNFKARKYDIRIFDVEYLM